jgi:pimeloyl-ACP methyl ester carboxylesterase
MMSRQTWRETLAGSYLELVASRNDGWRQSAQRRHRRSQTDFTEDLKKITVPVLVMHGDDDQIVPYPDSAPLSAKLLRNSTLKTYKGFPHGMPTTEAATINVDLLALIKKGKEATV